VTFECLVGSVAAACMAKKGVTTVTGDIMIQSVGLTNELYIQQLFACLKSCKTLNVHSCCVKTENCEYRLHTMFTFYRCSQKKPDNISSH